MSTGRLLPVAVLAGVTLLALPGGVEDTRLEALLRATLLVGGTTLMVAGCVTTARRSRR